MYLAYFWPIFVNIFLSAIFTLSFWGFSQSVHSLSRVQLFVTPWTVASQASLSINSWSLLKLMTIKLVMPSNHLILCRPLLLLPSIFPASGSFPMSQFFASGGQGIGASASASVLSMTIQYWFPIRLTGLLSLQSKGLSRVFSSTAARKQQFFSAQSSLWSNSQQSYMTTGKTIALTTQTFISKVMSLLFNTLSKFVIAFLPRSKYLLILYRKKRGWQMNYKYTKCSSKAMSGPKSTRWHLLAWKYQSKSSWNFLGSPVVKNLPSNAGDIGSIPGPGATKPMCCNYWGHVLQSPHATTREKPVCWN